MLYKLKLGLALGQFPNMQILKYNHKWIPAIMNAQEQAAIKFTAWISRQDRIKYPERSTDKSGLLQIFGFGQNQIMYVQLQPESEQAQRPSNKLHEFMNIYYLARTG